MKNGNIEPEKDHDTLMSIYNALDIDGNLKRPLTVEEQVLIFAIAKKIKECSIDGKRGNKGDMDNLVELHDACMDYEIAILDDADMLIEKRNQAVRSRDKNVFKEIIPVLNSIIQDAELYKQFLDEMEEEQQ